MTARLLLFAALSVTAAFPVAAQDRSPIDDLIARARRALDDLEYSRAASIGRTLLEMGDRATPSQRISGLQLMAAALYPEEEPAQRADSARLYLQKLARATPNALIPRAISWPGLDSLLASLRRSTFAVWAEPGRRHELAGPDAELRIVVAASRAARFHLSAVPVGTGYVIALDSAGPEREATLVIRGLADDRPVLSWGRYTLRITGTDTLSGERVELNFPATVDAPPLELLDVPGSLDSSLLRPERGPRRTVLNVLLGLGLGTATAITATAFGGSDAVGSASLSNRPYFVGVGMTLGALIGAFADRGTLLRQNVEHNRRVHEDLAQQIRRLRAENAQRRAGYRATIVIEGGVR